MKLGLIAELARYFGEHAQRRFGWSDFFAQWCHDAGANRACHGAAGLGWRNLAWWHLACHGVFAGANWRHFGALLLVAVVAFLLGWFVVFHDYQRERIITFVNPASDPLDGGYNVIQATIAIGAGGVLGTGLGAGSQSQLRFLPEAQADFVFAVIAEELGFIGVVVLLLFLPCSLFDSSPLPARHVTRLPRFLCLACLRRTACRRWCILVQTLRYCPQRGWRCRLSATAVRPSCCPAYCLGLRSRLR